MTLQNSVTVTGCPRSLKLKADRISARRKGEHGFLPLADELWEESQFSLMI